MERVELVAHAVAAEVAGVLGALLDIVATQPRVVLRPAVPRQRAAPTRLPSWHRWHWRHSDVQAQVHRAVRGSCYLFVILTGLEPPWL